ncbi:hypothetical protein STRCI_007205 [Streptomyces cinnabarinus]|uniref:Conjugal transfer protein TrbL n=1 Tax=Streptomyces cinnabarinus TaxID=67287 RepID=A0ABY7KMA8_9ACTN|nr:hypothetical protein [Streptomyces cinnabarinus]WAZ25694.1 hypothetical protein STRCI_007205 [Streptomyces cinnabarinus]
MNCPTGNPVIDLIKGFFDFLGNPIGTVIELIANSILAGAIAVFGALITGVPTLTGTATAKDVGSQTQWLVVYLAVGSLIFASVRMALERRGTAGVTALKGILRVILVSGAATTVVTAAAAVADDYATFLFNAGAKAQLSNVGACKSGENVESFLLLILAFLLLISGIIHTILMYIRLGVMILLLGTLPVAAAASMTDWGAGWWRKHIGWMIAWLLYKPAAGLVLYSGSAMISQGGQGGDINERIAGIGLMLLSAVSLPALLKLVVPATAALGGGNPVSGALSAAGGALATGARSLGGAAGGTGGQAGGAGPKGPSGAGSSGGGSQGGAPGPGGPAGGNGSNGAGWGGAAGAGAGGGGSGAAAGAGRAAAAAGGPVGAAVTAAVTAAQIVGSTAAGAVDGADGDLGHNTGR